MMIPHMPMFDLIVDGILPPPRLLLARCSRIRSEWQLPNMQAPFWRCYLPLAGGGIITLNGNDYPLRARELMLIPPETPAQASHQRDFIKAYANLVWPLAGKQALPAVHTMPSLPQERQALRQIIKRSDGHALSLLMLSCACRAMYQLDSTAFTEQTQASPLIARACTLIESHIAEPLSNETLALLFGLHPGSFIRRFSAEMQCSPQRYSREHRLREACRLLLDQDESIDAIATACGFADRAHFTRAFSKRWHCPPAAFRQRNSR